MKNFERSKRVVKNSLEKFFVRNSDILLMYHESGDSKAHYNSALVDRFWRATEKKLYRGFVGIIIFVTFL